MIYASDLDRTLIYSPAALGVPEDTPGLLPAEIQDGRVLSYISRAALAALAALPPDVVFMPVTTRTVSQYKRINLFQETVIPDYAVTSNGGNILVGGVIDEAWRQSVGAKVMKESASEGEVRPLVLAALREEWMVSERRCDELFYTYVVHRDLVPVQTVLELSDKLDGLGWRVSLQGRKLYVVPSAVNKSDAIAHVRRTVLSEPMAASGDSLLDLCLLDSADYAIVPPHGEIFAQRGSEAESPYRFTSKSGVFAADEILRLVIERYHRLPPPIPASNHTPLPDALN